MHRCQGSAVIAIAQLVGHIIDHRIQHRLHHRIDVGLFHRVGAGIGADLLDLACKGGHGAVGDIDQVGAKIRRDALMVGSKMAGDPADQIPLALLFKLHNGGMIFDRIGKLFQAAIRFPLGGHIGKDHGAVIGNIRNGLDDLLPVCVRKLENINFIHPNHGVFRHHRQVFHTIGECIQVESLVIQLVKIKGLGQFVDQKLAHLIQVVIQQEGLFTMENIEPVCPLLPKGQLQLLKTIAVFFFLCHGITS